MLTPDKILGIREDFQTDEDLSPRVKENLLDLCDLALHSLTAMEGEGVEVPELEFIDSIEKWHAEDGRWSSLDQLLTTRRDIRRNNAEPVLRALVAKLEAELKEATTDQPTMAGLTTVMDERDAALALVKELREGLEELVGIVDGALEDSRDFSTIDGFTCQPQRTLIERAKGVK